MRPLIREDFPADEVQIRAGVDVLLPSVGPSSITLANWSQQAGQLGEQRLGEAERDEHLPPLLGRGRHGGGRGQVGPIGEAQAGELKALRQLGQLLRRRLEGDCCPPPGRTSVPPI